MSNNIYTSAYRPYLPQINHRKITEQNQEEFSESTRGKQKAIQEYRNLPQQAQQQTGLPQQYQYQYQNKYQPQYQNTKQPYQYNYNNFNQNKQNGQRQTPEVKNIVKSMNIQQILIDFKSTINAIGASEEVEEEVKGYLELIDKQTQKENPNKKVIISNLKVCANLLDNYISETLNKPSKVVKDWVEALLMQPIDFKADKTLTKGAFETITGEPPQTAKLAQEKLAQKEASAIKQQEIINQPEKSENETLQENVIWENEQTEPSEILEQAAKISQNSEIQNIINKADTIKNGDAKSAMNLYSEAFKLAQKENNKNMMAKIYSKIGTLQNTSNNLVGALDCLNASTLLAYECGETELMADNHAQMGKIYDEKGMFEPAFNHYHRSVALNGELENLDKQTETLTQVGDMFSERYFANEALGYYDLALDMAKENKNYENASNIFRHCAKTNENSGKLENAMKNLKNAATISNNIKDDKEVVSIYEQAGDMMKKMGHNKKAADLYKKAYRIAQRLDDKELQENLISKM